MPLALFGGTFDPVHYGHLRCAEESRQKLCLDKLFLLPAGQPAHKDSPGASTAQRLHMLHLAQKEFPQLELDLSEINREGPSYMVDTLAGIRGQNPDKPLILLIGQDSANELNRWHRWSELFSLAHIVILSRPGIEVGYRSELAQQIEKRLVDDANMLSQSQAGCVLQLKVNAIDICATTIKSMMQLGRSPSSMLPGSVLEYIIENGLYTAGKQT
jgi:nicotinate-nucleotide adenylyltransferase